MKFCPLLYLLFLSLPALPQSLAIATDHSQAISLVEDILATPLTGWKADQSLDQATKSYVEAYYKAEQFFLPRPFPGPIFVDHQMGVKIQVKATELLTLSGHKFYSTNTGGGISEYALVFDATGDFQAPLNQLASRIKQIHPMFKLGFSAGFNFKTGFYASVIKHPPGGQEHSLLLLPYRALDRFRIKDPLIAHELIHMTNKASLLKGVIPQCRGSLRAINAGMAMAVADYRYPEFPNNYRHFMNIDELEAYVFQLQKIVKYRNDPDAIQSDFYFKKC